MSLESMKVYNVRCDRCGATLYDDIWWPKETAEDDLINEDWVIHKRKHYCPNCYDEDEDENITIKPPIDGITLKN